MATAALGLDVGCRSRLLSRVSGVVPERDSVDIEQNQQRQDRRNHEGEPHQAIPDGMTRCSWMGNISTLQVVECALSRNPVSFFSDAVSGKCRW